MKSWMLKLVVIVAVLLAIGWGAVAWVRPEVPVAAVERDRAVRVAPASLTVLAEVEMDVRSEVGGRVVDSRLEVGSSVQAGDLLLKFDTTDLELEIERIESELRAAVQRREVGSTVELELANARERLAELERRVARGEMPAAEFVREQRSVQAIEQRLAQEQINAQLQMEMLENSLQARRRQLEKMSVRAPVEGVLVAVYAHRGDLIGAAAPLARIISASRIVEARVSEEVVDGLRPGLPATVRFLGYSGQTFSARVSRVLPAADPQTQRYVAHLEVAIDRQLLVPGITGEASITLAEREAALVAPREALVGRHVFVLRHGRVELQPVQTGFVSLNQVEILSGVEQGDLVVVGGHERLRSGDRVRVANR
jgi:RND family efflux transporter MFP subunit